MSSGDPPPQEEAVEKLASSETTEKNGSEEKKDDASPKPEEIATMGQLFSFAKTPKSRGLLILGAFAAVISGCVLPAMAYLFARVFSDLSGDVSDGDEFMEKARNLAFTFMVLGVILFVSMSSQATFMETAAIHMSHEMQKEWFEALLRQDMAFHDQKDSTGEATLITVHGNKYKKGVGKKLAGGIQYLITFIGGMAYSFYASWRNSLIVLAVVPFMSLSALFLVQMNTSQSARANASYAKAGSIVNTAIRSIRTLSALNAIPRTIDDYKQATREAQVGATQQVGLLGLATGSQLASVLLAFLVVTLFGTWLLYDNVLDTGCDPSGTVDDNPTCDPSSIDVLGSLMGIFIASSVLPQVSTAMEALSGARFACYPAIRLIERSHGIQSGKKDVKDVQKDEEEGSSVAASESALPPLVIDSASPEGLKPETVVGDIAFQNVFFSYPTRREQTVFRDFSLKIPAGTTVALCGASGGGKSTAIALLERFYDPIAGQITLDGNDLKDLNVQWLRQHVGLVSQEPKLFDMSVGENIASGALTKVTQDEIEDAARRANAHDFIMGFPHKYDTKVGDLGGQLSGGQRQRIAIARVLIKKPRILLLDEATSALDSESEQTVQKALDALMESSQMTVFVIAHRLSTIRNADMIAVLSDGKVAESGSHSELVAKEGMYHALVQKQQLTTSGDEADRKKMTDSMRQSTIGSSGNLEDDGVGQALIQLENVGFTYPARPDVKVFKHLSLTVHKGETLALCGPSGQGKSTVIQLVERFYDCDEGRILYNGKDLRDLNVTWYRNELGLVSQEPTLFDCSVRENIAYGAPNATQVEIEEAARKANCHSFIMSFPEGYDTRVGSDNSLLVSGGQKQRICIARALLKKPKVLLLDEATSALDSQSEKMVQESLDSLMEDRTRTTIVIAHRLSTIRNADRIAVIDKGKVSEIGSHDELMAKKGRYSRLVELQNLGILDTGTITEESEPTESESTVKQVEASADPVSQKEEAAKEPEQEQIDKELEKKNAQRARALAFQESRFFMYGAIGAIFGGVVFPGWGVGFGYMIEVLYTSVLPCDETDVLAPFDTCDDYYDDVADDMQKRARNISLGYAALAVSVMCGCALLYWGFGNASERINKNVRDMAFTAVIRQEISFFDMKAPSLITSQLAEDAAVLHSFLGEPIRSLTLSIASVLVGLVISVVYMWPFALLTIGIIPFMAFGAEMEMAMYYGEDEGDDLQIEGNSAGNVAIEALSNIRTIAALTLEERKADEYDKALSAAHPHPIRTSFVKGSGAGLGQLVQMWGYALMFFFGGWLLVNFEMTTFTFTDYVVSMFALMFSLYGLTLAAEGAVDGEKAKAGANRIFALTDRKSQIDPLSKGGEKDFDIQDT